MNNLLLKRLWQTALLIFSPLLLFCQVTTFKKATTDISNSDATCIIETENGYIIGGLQSNINDVTGDGYMMNIDKSGQVMWNKNYGSKQTDRISSIISSNEKDGYIAFGITEPAISSHYDTWGIKVDTLGNKIWEIRNGEVGFNEILNAKIVTTDNGYVVSSTKRTNSSQNGCMATKLSNSGETIWSQYYIFNNNQDISSIKNYGIRIAGDSVLYGSGTNGNNAVFYTINPADGSLVHAVEYENPSYNIRCSDLLNTSDGNFFLTGYLLNPGENELLDSDKLIWIAKINPTGNIIWSKTIAPSFLWARTPFRWALTNDGGIVGCAMETLSSSPSDIDPIVALRLDSFGNCILKKTISIEPTGLYQAVVDIIQTSDGGFAGTGSFFSNNNLYNLSFLIKTDSLLGVFDCCSKNKQIIPSVNFDLELKDVPFEQTDYLPFTRDSLTPNYMPNLSMVNICLTPQPQVTRTVVFCPGDTVWIANVPYTQAGTFSDIILTSSEYCDTLATYILQYDGEGYASNLTIKCPDNIALQAPAGASSLPIIFAEPMTSTDCPCPNLSTVQTAGISSGNFFPLGITTVCYNVSDDCGNAQSCCFEVKIDSEISSDDFCDEKTSGCAQFSIEQISRNSQGEWVYRIRLTNSCADPVRFAYFQVPDGTVPVEPNTGAGYISPSGNVFIVKSPNFSPFYSIRFQPSNAMFLANGQSEIFRYALPPQASVSYIHAAARFVSGAFAETHLNTFNCVVTLEQPKGTQELNEREEYGPNGEKTIVYPNPISSGSTLNILNLEAEGAKFCLYDLSGKLLLTQPILESQISFPPLKNGVYLGKVKQNGQPIYLGKIVVMNHAGH